MIEIRIKDEIIISKKLLLGKFAEACRELGFSVNSYYLTEYFDETPTGYKIELFEKFDK